MLVSSTQEFSYFRKKLCLEVKIELLKENICNTIIAGLYFVRHGKTEFLAVAESARIPYSTLRSNLKSSTENSKCFFHPSSEVRIKGLDQELVRFKGEAKP